MAAGTEVRLGHEPTSGPGSAGTGDWDLTASPARGLMAPGDEMGPCTMAGVTEVPWRLVRDIKGYLCPL